MPKKKPKRKERTTRPAVTAKEPRKEVFFEVTVEREGFYKSCPGCGEPHNVRCVSHSHAECPDPGDAEHKHFHCGRCEELYRVTRHVA
jgi:hypothetical protein